MPGWMAGAAQSNMTGPIKGKRKLPTDTAVPAPTVGGGLMAGGPTAVAPPANGAMGSFRGTSASTNQDTQFGTAVPGQVGKWLPGSYNQAQSAVNAGMPHLQNVLANPSALPPGAEERALKQQEEAYQLAANRMRGNVAANRSAFGDSGMVSTGMGNVEMARGAGMADTAEKLSIEKAGLQDERLRSLLLPLQSEQNDLYKAALAKAEAKKKRSWLKTIAGAGISAAGVMGAGFTGGASLAAVGPGLQMMADG